MFQNYKLISTVQPIIVASLELVDCAAHQQYQQSAARGTRQTAHGTPENRGSQGDEFYGGGHPTSRSGSLGLLKVGYDGANMRYPAPFLFPQQSVLHHHMFVFHITPQYNTACPNAAVMSRCKQPFVARLTDLAINGTHFVIPDHVLLQDDAALLTPRYPAQKMQQAVAYLAADI